MDSPPDAGTCSRAVARAAHARRQRARNDPRHIHLTPAALEERIVGIAALPRRGKDGWWLVGHVLDSLDDADGEFDVWYLPAERGAPRLGISSRPAPPPVEPPRPAERYFCGLRLQWIDVGEPVEAPD